MTGASVGQGVWPGVESAMHSTASDTQMERCGTQREGGEDMAEQDRRVTRRIGPLDIAWPRSIGYYGGIGLAVAAGMVGAPVALSVAAIPLLKMLNRPTVSWATGFVAPVRDGAAKPVGGDAEATIQLTTLNAPVGRQRGLAPRSRPAPHPAARAWCDESRRLGLDRRALVLGLAGASNGRRTGR